MQRKLLDATLKLYKNPLVIIVPASDMFGNGWESAKEDIDNWVKLCDKYLHKQKKDTDNEAT